MNEQVSALAKQYESRAEKLRIIEALIADDPDLIADLRRLLHKQPRKAARKIDIVVRFFQSKGDVTMSAGQVAEGTGLPRNTVNFLLFASKHKGLFESEMLGPKQKLWRLKPTSTCEI